MRFKGKRVLITGAASGIGRVTAILLAHEGARLAIGDIDETGLTETAALMATPPRMVPVMPAIFPRPTR